MVGRLTVTPEQPMARMVKAAVRKRKGFMVTSGYRTKLRGFPRRARPAGASTQYTAHGPAGLRSPKRPAPGLGAGLFSWKSLVGERRVARAGLRLAARGFDGWRFLGRRKCLSRWRRLSERRCLTLLGRHVAHGGFPVHIRVVGRLHTLQAEPDSPRLRVDLDHPQGERLAFLQYLARMLDARLRQLGDVDQALDLVVAFQARKGAEFRQLGDRGGDQLPFVQRAEHFRPRILRQSFHRQADAFALAFDPKHAHAHLLPDLEHLRGVVDAFPGNLRQVYQPVRAP